MVPVTLLMPDGPGPIYASQGGVAASYQPGHELAEVEFAVHGVRTACTAVEARDLIAVLMQALTADVDLRLADGRPQGEER